MKLKLSNYKILFLFLSTIILLSGCMSNRYDLGNSLYWKKKYAAAIENYDVFLSRTDNGALAIEAEEKRSDCYYQLGKKAMKINKIKLAVRFFFLANNSEADDLLDDCYFQLSQEALLEKKFTDVLSYYNRIIEKLPASELVPEIYYNRIKINMEENNDDVSAWNDYKLLCDKYSDSEYIEKSQFYINQFANKYLEKALSRENSRGYDKILEDLFVLAQYPTSISDRIYREIGKNYLLLAEEYVIDRKFLKAEYAFRAAIDYDLTLKEHVDLRLNEICDLFIEKGNELLKERNIDGAIQLYEKTFTIRPNYEKATMAILNAKTLESNIASAIKLVQKGDIERRKKNYKKALQYYKLARNADALKSTQRKIFLMRNNIEIEKDPIDFTKRITFAYKKGILTQKIEAIVNQLKSKYGEDVKDSGWKVFLSLGHNQYEIRYDISTPESSYFFVWQVDLLEKQITPLNNASEELMN